MVCSASTAINSPISNPPLDRTPFRAREHLKEAGARDLELPGEIRNEHEVHAQSEDH